MSIIRKSALIFVLAFCFDAIGMDQEDAKTINHKKVQNRSAEMANQACNTQDHNERTEMLSPSKQLSVQLERLRRRPRLIESIEVLVPVNEETNICGDLYTLFWQNVALEHRVFILDLVRRAIDPVNSICNRRLSFQSARQVQMLTSDEPPGFEIESFLVSSATHTFPQSPIASGIFAAKDISVSNMPDKQELAGQYIEIKSRLPDVVLEKSWTVLHEKVRRADLLRGELLVRDRAVELNALDKNGATPLIVAILLGHTKIAQMLIEAGADLDIFTNEGLSALHYAVKGGLSEVLCCLLLSKGVSPNLQTKTGRPPLHYAAGKGNINVVEMLLAAGAEVDSGMDGTPLFAAAQKDDEEIINLLIRHGAKVNALAIETMGDKFHWHYRSPLFDAVEHGKFKAVKCLLEHGALLKLSDRGTRSIEDPLLNLLLKKKHDKKHCNCLEILKLLLCKGINLALIKKDLLHDIIYRVRDQKHRPTALNSIVMFQLIGPSVLRK